LGLAADEATGHQARGAGWSPGVHHCLNYQVEQGVTHYQQLPHTVCEQCGILILLLACVKQIFVNRNCIELLHTKLRASCITLAGTQGSIYAGVHICL
jgi:hypothetical protein